MEQTTRLKPAPGRQVRMPAPPYELMPEAGCNVPMTPYWARRVRARDAVPADDLPAPADQADPRREQREE